MILLDIYYVISFIYSHGPRVLIVLPLELGNHKQKCKAKITFKRKYPKKHIT